MKSIHLLAKNNYKWKQLLLGIEETQRVCNNIWMENALVWNWLQWNWTMVNEERAQTKGGEANIVHIGHYGYSYFGMQLRSVCRREVLVYAIHFFFSLSVRNKEQMNMRLFVYCCLLNIFTKSSRVCVYFAKCFAWHNEALLKKREPNTRLTMRTSEKQNRRSSLVASLNCR